MLIGVRKHPRGGERVGSIEGTYDLARPPSGTTASHVQKARSVPLALPERVDFLAQRGSLSTQIARTYLRITGRGGDPGLLKEQMFVAVAASVAASIVAELVSPERLLELLQTGRPADVVPNTRPIAGGLSPQSLGNAWRVYLNSESGIGRFFPG